MRSDLGNLLALGLTVLASLVNLPSLFAVILGAYLITAFGDPGGYVVVIVIILIIAYFLITAKERNERE